MCGICGLMQNGGDSVNLVYYMEYCLQHRGQESFGVAATDGTSLVVEKMRGLVSTFSQDNYNSLNRGGRLIPIAAIGHNRYSNTGGDDFENYQPFLVQTKFGKIALAHNGNIPDTIQIQHKLCQNHFNPDGSSDSELIAQLIALYSFQSNVKTIEEAISQAVHDLRGAFSLVILTKDKLIGLRDPWGIRPLCLGKLNGSGFVLASETSAIEAIGATWIHDIAAGEMIVLASTGSVKHVQLFNETCEKMCIFEHIYFGAPASIMRDRLLKTSRRHMGENLWWEHPVDIVNPDQYVVGGVPDTGVPMAQGLADAAKLEYRDIFQRNRAIGRTFIQPDQRLRELGVKLKLLPYRREINGKKLILVEDSIVRSTTMKQLVPLLFEAGALEVHVRISSPPYKYKCQLGTDTQRTRDLAAAKKTVEEIRADIGANSLGYLSIEGLIKAIDPMPGDGFCTGCFNEKYPFETSNSKSF